MDPGLFRRASGSDVGRNGNASGPAGQPVHPGDPVVGHVELALLLEINRRGDHRRHGDDHQQSVR